MSGVLALIPALVLVPVGLLHLLWATGVTWPCNSDMHLVRCVIGAPFDMRHPRNAALTVAVAAAITFAGLLPLAVVGLLGTGLPESLLRGLLMVEAGVFLLRGSYGYLPAMAKAAPLEPFRTLNRRYYNPLILLLGGICVALLALS
ncbi:MAG: DUF3995 domain-containing protein [Pseudomonadota bacterium]